MNEREFLPLLIAVLTVSDTRTSKPDDASGQTLIDRLIAAGHRLAGRAIVPDDIYRIQGGRLRLDRRSSSADRADHRRHRHDWP